MLSANISDLWSVKNKLKHLILLLFTKIAVDYMFNILEISRKNSRKKGTVFKPSFKFFKNEKIIFFQVILKLECFFYQNIYINYFILYYIRIAI